MSHEDLQIRLKVEQMIQYAYAPLRNFPKAEKHVLSAEIRQSMYRRLRKASINRFRRRLRAMQRRYAQDRITRHEITQRIVSWGAHARHGDALPIARRILAKAIFRRSAA